MFLSKPSTHDIIRNETTGGGVANSTTGVDFGNATRWDGENTDWRDANITWNGTNITMLNKIGNSSVQVTN